MLKGAEGLLQACHPIVHVEFNREDIMKEVVYLLSSLDYDVRCVLVGQCTCHAIVWRLFCTATVTVVFGVLMMVTQGLSLESFPT